MSIDTKVASDPIRRRLRRVSTGERREEARAFLRQFARESGRGDTWLAARTAEVDRALARTGHYEHSAEELAFGARVAWRNHARCIGRLWWKSLDVVDCRHLTDPDAVADRLFAHLAEAWHGGRIRPVISIFAPVAGNRVPVTIESPQLLHYAGYLDDTDLLGDRQNVEWTRTAIALGWEPPSRRSAFDRLPLVLRDGEGRRLVYPLPPGLVPDIAIRHPAAPRVAELGLAWYPVPVVAGMVLSIGGLDYPAAPFNGYYMATEIASRNLADERRYNRLAEVADALGLDRTRDRLWKDTALTELNRAVLWSFEQAGATIVDHHAASESYMEFARREQSAGRIPSADWSWIVPPQASAACPVFHLPMANTHAVPNYYWSRSLDGGKLRVDRRLERRGVALRRWDRLKHRLRRFRRDRDWLW